MFDPGNVMQRGIVIADQITSVAKTRVEKWDRMATLRAWTPFLVLMGWLVIGMFVFYGIESPVEDRRLAALNSFEESFEDPQKEVVELNFNENDSSSSGAGGVTNDDAPTSQQGAIDRFNDRLSSLLDKPVFNVTISKNGRNQYVVTVIYGNESATNHIRRHYQSSQNKKWDIPGSLFFCLAVVTTIGYGNTAPYTNMGKFLCVIYAIFGIPLFMVVVQDMRFLLTRNACRLHKTLYGLAKRFERRSKKIAKTIKSRKSVLNRRASAIERFAKAVDRHEVRAATGIVAIVGCLVFIFVPSFLFVYIEGWDYLSSLYFCFISLTTIGFGDLIAGQHGADAFSHGIYRIVLCAWLFFGIAFVATLTHVTYILVDNLLARIRCDRNGSNEDEDTEGNVEDATNKANNQNDAARRKTVNLLDIIDKSLLSDGEGCSSKQKQSPTKTAVVEATHCLTQPTATSAVSQDL